MSKKGPNLSVSDAHSQFHQGKADEACGGSILTKNQRWNGHHPTIQLVPFRYGLNEYLKVLY